MGGIAIDGLTGVVSNMESLLGIPFETNTWLLARSQKDITERRGEPGRGGRNGLPLQPEIIV